MEKHPAARTAPLPAPSRPGITLVELMVSVSILTIGILAMVETFGYLQKAIQASKNRTLASNLVQEKMQILKQKAYYQVLITTAPGHNNTDFSPEVVDYDTGYFPPENIVEAGVTYVRYTLVQPASEDSGELVLSGPGVPDTGMKYITVAVVWRQGGVPKKISISSVLANPDTVMSNAIFRGRVLDADTLLPVEGATVNVSENSGWKDTVDALGNYSISCSPGNYNLAVSAAGYYSVIRPASVSAASTQVVDFSLARIATGTIVGAAWVANHLVISQIVGSTIAASGYDQEYIEIFNPTTSTWRVDGEIGLRFRRSSDSQSRELQIDYFTESIEPESFYLFANTTTVVAAGGDVTADAVWSDSNSTTDFPFFSSQHNAIPVDENGVGEGGGAIELYSDSAGTLDRVGWNKSGWPAPFYETAAIPQVIGLSRNELFARLTSTGDASGGVSQDYGPAYDSGSNDRDFYDYSSFIAMPPRASMSGTRSVISATPAAGAVVYCSDGLSAPVSAVLSGSPPAAYFTLTDVSTGTWTLIISSGTSGYLNDSVSVPSAGAVHLHPSSVTILDTEMSGGFISGTVLNAEGTAISPAITVTPGAMGAPISANTSTGRYFLMVSSGVVDVTANPVSGVNPAYVSLSSNSIAIASGELHPGVDFVLYQGGRVRGFVTRDGVNPLPGVAVALLDTNGISADQQVSDLNGYFTTVNVSTGLYYVRPVVGDNEYASPEYILETVDDPGDTVFAGTFTVTGAMGYIRGSITAGGEPVKTGALVVVTTVTISGNPPAPPELQASMLTGAPYYVVSSFENGTYLAEVRGSPSVPYNVYTYYTTLTPTDAAISFSSATGITVLSGETVTGVNFSW